MILAGKPALDIRHRAVGVLELEAGLARAAARADDPVAGVFGPGSQVWQVQKEALVFFGAARAMMLQTAHPWVAEGVARQSRAMADPIGRFHRTFEIVFSLVFGSVDQACVKARKLHRIHTAIRGEMSESLGPFPAGSAYTANDANAMLWVHATLWDTSVRMHEAVLGPLTPEERDAYYAESRAFAWMFGIPEEIVPADWSGFEAYVAAMTDSDILTVGRAGREIVDALVLGGGGRFWRRLPRWYVALTLESLPPRLREGFGMEYGPAEAALAARAWERIRVWYPRLPDRLRLVPSYREALGRIAGARGPDPLTRALNLLWVGRSRLVG